MKTSSFISALLTAARFATVSANPAPLVAVRTTPLPGKSEAYTLNEIRRRVYSLFARQEETNQTLRNTLSIDKSWEEAVLFQHTHEFDTKNENLSVSLGIEVRCATCYVKASATAELFLNGTFDFGDTIANLTDQLGEEFENMTSTAIDSVKNFVGDIDLSALNPFDDKDFDFSEAFNFDNFTIDTDFDIDLPPLPEVVLSFSLDELDIYLLLGTKITGSATLNIPLYKSKSLGIGTTKDLEVGVFVTMDLILSVDGEIDFTTGVHFRVEDGIAFRLAFLSHNVSEIILNGGEFEFLPVTVLTANAVLKAILRVGMHAGVNLNTPSAVEEKLQVGAGVEVGVFAHLAEFITNVTAGAILQDEEDCALKVVEEYTFGVGAVAGATVQVFGQTFGPQPTTTIPVFYTTLADICAIQASASPTTAPATTTSASLAARQDNLVTTTITTVDRYTAVGCKSPDLAALCPQNLLTTSVQTSTLTLVTSVPPGVTATFPASIVSSVASTIPFGTQAKSISSTSGLPTSFVPPPPPPTSTSSSSAAASSSAGGGGFGSSVEEIVNGQTGGVDNKLIIGLSVGLGVPFLIAVGVAIAFLIKRHRYQAVPKKDAAETDVFGSSEYQSPMSGGEAQGLMKKTPMVATAEAI